MIPTLLRKLHDFSRILVVRVLLIAMLAVLAIALAKVFSAFIPDGISYKVGAEAVDSILQILATSMLTVTTFSLTVMAATHRSVSSLWTPRAHQILLQDTTTHNVLATFMGAYVYALVAIILRETEVFAGEELLVLFGMTILVALLVVAAIIRWISHLEMFGSLIETGGRIEQRTTEAWRLRAGWPTLGAEPLADVPRGGTRVVADDSGYLQQIYQDRLQKAAEEADARIWITQHVGDFIHRGEVLAVTDSDDEDLAGRIRNNISIGSLRNYAQDPEFGLLCLSEIGSRAMSPGINDPGTCIDVIGRMSRIILSFGEVHGGEELRYDRIFVEPFDVGECLERTFVPLARDSAGFYEVHRALRRSLAAIAGHPDPALSAAALRIRAEAEAIAQEGMDVNDIKRVLHD
ncbi:hypothetical protein GCM10011534_09310 [Pseudooceanicola nanhaiensis]|jgi:uncharacterized membrane protein|uniref:DUF2254 domain-containing protein n=1 Tax=Pseudooceanicola nanhaiensis TaxID=375761 RepID=A0A917WB55_9RHOB|nr:DUF2254 domain-containing protein [Pseudooceanicola nanhaiensis]GGL89294.1 hypothetical protein GCM10011534_09310 [Pseudooceanicola nanhaiensis]